MVSGRGRLQRHTVLSLLSLVVVLAGAILLDRLVVVTAGRPVRDVSSGGAELAPPPVSSARFAPAVAALAGAPLTYGHEVEVLADAELFDRLLADIAGARRSVTLYLYFCEPGTLGDRLGAGAR